MFGISFPELIVVGIVAFLILGPNRIAAGAEDLGRLVRKLKEKLTHYKQTVLSDQVDLSSFFNTDIELNKTLDDLQNKKSTAVHDASEEGSVDK